MTFLILNCSSFLLLLLLIRQLRFAKFANGFNSFSILHKILNLKNCDNKPTSQAVKTPTIMATPTNENMLKLHTTI